MKALSLAERGRLDVYVLAVTSAVSAETRSRAQAMADAGAFEMRFWTLTELDDMVKSHPDVLREFFLSDDPRRAMRLRRERQIAPLADEVSALVAVVRPILGALVSWRCTRRGCTGLRETKYDFRRPRKNQAANAFSRPMPEVESGSGLALAMASSLETNNAPIFGED